MSPIDPPPFDPPHQSGALPASPWLEPLYSAEQMGAIDHWAIQAKGIPSLDLMERAGEGVARAVTELAPVGRIVIFCGKGNNGGDGLAVARLLREQGRDVDVVMVAGVDSLSPDAAVQLGSLPGPGPQSFPTASTSGIALIVDALLGTGFAGEPRSPLSDAIELINSSGVPVLSVDVPSGVDASTGEQAGVAVRADMTVTFQHGKPGLWISPGKQHAGAVRVCDIGIPPGAPTKPSVGLINDRVLDGIARRSRDSTKFSSGNVVVIGGSHGLTGAPSLAALGAMRSGAGYVTIAGPASLEAAFSARPLETMLAVIPDLNGSLGVSAVESLLRATARADCVVLGPGLGKSDETRQLVRELVPLIKQPLVVDADGLNAVAGALELFVDREAPTVLTPHAGELGRLLEIDSQTVNAHRLDCLTKAVAVSGAVVLLKGDDTLVCSPTGPVAVSPGNAPSLATAGTGDVLAGAVGALLARSGEEVKVAEEVWRLVCAAMFAHLRAGQIAAGPFGPDGVTASDVAAVLPEAFGASHDE